MDLGLKGKVALVTGGSKGIGRRIAEQYASEGASVGICARNAEEVAAAVEALKAKGVNAYGAACDVTDADAFKAWFEAAAEALGGVDIFVSNVSGGGGMEGEASWRKNFETDLLPTVRGVELAIPHLAKRGGGAIVFISTTAAIETFLAPQAYNAIKAALITYAKQLSQAVAGMNIRVNTVSPGPIYFAGGAWNWIEHNMADLYKGTLAGHPLGGRMGKPEEVADAVVYLSSERSSWITGVNLVVDGGYTKRVQF
jgi:NAD(P)-dependent dehydrogenase (short-subunit alcohol dehydrogenase family)